MKNLRFLTASGSWYEIRDGYWKRLSTTERSGPIRQEQGHIVGEPSVEVGQPALIEDDSVLEGLHKHFVHTSPVVVIQT